MGRTSTVERRKYQIQSVWAKHHEIKRLELLGISSNKVIAEQLGVTPQNVCDIRGSELYKAELRSASFAKDCATFEVAKAIEEEGPKCLMLLTAIRDNRTDILGESAPLPLRAHICEDLLDRNVKSAKVKQIQGEFRHAHVVVETTLEKIKERARAIQGYIEDAMSEEIKAESGDSEGGAMCNSANTNEVCSA